MSEKIYTSFQIPSRTEKADSRPDSGNPSGRSPSDATSSSYEASAPRVASTLPDGSFYEIEYDSTPFPGVGKFVKRTVTIEAPEETEERQLRRTFHEMRELARSYRTHSPDSFFFSRAVQENNARIFYRQAQKMKDFSDDYDGIAPFSAYFPVYQQMSYEQLRTYFTWRTQVRAGTISDIPLSYAFVYLYELLANIGVQTHQEGLNRLFAFWEEFRDYDDSLDKYVLRWLKDYHIYYPLAMPFEEFVQKHDLMKYFPEIAHPEDTFALFCPISKYAIQKSAFYTEERKDLIHDCFVFLVDKLRMLFFEHGLDFDEAIFQPAKKMPIWRPFQDALFHPWLKQPDRRVIFSHRELYLCRNNQWTHSAVLTSDRGRVLVGYLMKQMEVILRQLTHYRYKLSADRKAVTHEAVSLLEQDGIFLEKVITDIVREFYKETTKIVIQVDTSSLERIRQEALLTQERLMVETEEVPVLLAQERLTAETEENVRVPLEATNLEATKFQSPDALPEVVQLELFSDPIFPASASFKENEPLSAWAALIATLTETECEVLALLLAGSASLPELARRQGILPEVLADGINEKAMDTIGDSLMDEEFILYEEYTELLKEALQAKTE